MNKQTKPNQTTVHILQDVPNQWVLRIASNTGTCQEFVTRYTFKRLIDALEAACLLQIHVTNAALLPLNQYYKVV